MASSSSSMPSVIVCVKVFVYSVTFDSQSQNTKNGSFNSQTMYRLICIRTFPSAFHNLYQHFSIAENLMALNYLLFHFSLSMFRWMLQFESLISFNFVSNPHTRIELLFKLMAKMNWKCSWLGILWIICILTESTWPFRIILF